MLNYFINLKKKKRGKWTYFFDEKNKEKDAPIKLKTIAFHNQKNCVIIVEKKESNREKVGFL